MEDNELSSGIQMANAYAVIIGIGKYKDPTIPTLKYTHVDANDLYDVLINPRRIGMQKDNVRLLLDEEATLQNIKSTVGTWLLRKADEDSTVIIFFSGHGGIEPDPSGAQGKYLLPWDAWREDLYATAISSRDFEGLLQRIKSNRLVMFLDACHSGGVISREGTKDVVTIESLCADLAAGSGRAIIAASQGNQQSFEDDKLGHGIFAHHLLEALKGKADTDRDGRVTLTEAFKYLEREVPRTALELAGAVQEPMMRGELTKDIVLAIDMDRLEEIRKEKEQAAQEVKKREDKRKLYQWRRERKLSTEQYDKALKVYEADAELLDEQDREIKELTHELLEGKLAVENYVYSINIILEAAEKAATEAAIKEREAVERKEREEAEEAARKKAREEAEAKEKARREVEEKPVTVKQKLVKRKWFWAAVSVLVVVGGVLALWRPLLPPTTPTEQAPPEAPVLASPGSSSKPGPVLDSLTPILKWFAVSGADYYTLDISKNPSYREVIVVHNPQQLTGTSYTVPSGILEAGENYFWYIKAHGPGGWSNRSRYLYFRAPSAPVAVTYTLTVNLQGQGTVVLSPSGGSYSSGTQVTLTANPGSGWEFSHWGGSITGSQNPATITVNSDTNITATFVEQTIVTFPDANLEAAIRSAIGKPTGSITTADLEDLTSLKAIDKGIFDLTGMQYCTSLNYLDLGQNQISNISPLSSLVNLTHLDLAINQITDISPLASLTNLTRLTLSLNWFTDASPLASLTNLTSLWLTNCYIYDATPLASLTNLTGISLHLNFITDVSFAASLTKLETLYLGNNEISDISPLLSNSGLGTGDIVDLCLNPLSQTSINTYIPQLQARGVEVSYGDC